MERKSKAQKMMEYHKAEFLKYAKTVQDEEELRIATTHEIKVNLRMLQHWSAYLQGARMAVIKMIEEEGDYTNKVYRNAVIRLITSNIRYMGLWLTEGYDICFRNHKKDKKGKLISVEAYFAERVTIYREL